MVYLEQPSRDAKVSTSSLERLNAQSNRLALLNIALTAMKKGSQISESL